MTPEMSGNVCPEVAGSGVPSCQLVSRSGPARAGYLLLPRTRDRIFPPERNVTTSKDHHRTHLRCIGENKNENAAASALLQPVMRDSCRGHACSGQLAELQPG